MLATLQRVVRPQIHNHGVRMELQRRLKRRQALIDANTDDPQNVDVVARIEKLMYRRSGEDRDRVPVKHHARLACTRAAA